LLPLLLNGGLGEEDPGTARVWSAGERAVIDTLRLLRDEEPPANDVLAERIFLTCKEDLSFLFEILRRRRVPSYDEDPVQILSIYQEDVVLETVGRLERSRVKRFLRTRSEVERFDEGARRASIGFLGAVGCSQDFPEILRLCCRGEEGDMDPRLGHAVRRAVGRILREKRGYRDLLIANARLPVAFVREVSFAIGDNGDPRGLEFLVEALDWHDDLTMEVLGQVRKVGFCEDEEVDREARARVRSYLDLRRPMLARAAGLASAALDDTDAVPRLIGLLESGDRGLRANAHWALQRITRMRLSLTHDNWSRWYADEKRWVGERRLPAFRMLTSTGPGKITRAIAEISLHPTVRRDFNRALLELLESPFPRIRILVIEQLTQLGYASSRPYLEDARRDPVGEVAAAALAALEVLREPESASGEPSRSGS